MTVAWLAFTPDAPACAFLRGPAGVRSLCGAIRRQPEIFAQSNAIQRPRCGTCSVELERREHAGIPEGEARALWGNR